MDSTFNVKRIYEPNTTLALYTHWVQYKETALFRLHTETDHGSLYVDMEWCVALVQRRQVQGHRTDTRSLNGTGRDGVRFYIAWRHYIAYTKYLVPAI